MADHCFDTSSLVECWLGRYRRDIFASMWANLEGDVEAGRIRCPEDVFRETSKHDDGLHEWMKDQGEKLVVPLNEDIQKATREVLGLFPNLVKQSRGRNQADPFVIALARVEGLVVVTEESPVSSDNKPKIPRVCEHFGVECVNVLGYVQRRGWTY